MARGVELKRMDKDKELPVSVRLLCGGLAGAISQTSKSALKEWFSKCSFTSIYCQLLYSTFIYTTLFNTPFLFFSFL